MSAKIDKFKYIPNTKSYWLTFLGIAINMLGLFTLITSYSIKPDITIGITILVNILLLLVLFLASEKMKSYDIRWAVATIAIGVFNFIRVFIIPIRFYVSKKELPTSTFVWIVIEYVVASLIFIAAGTIAYKKSDKLRKHIKGGQN